MSDDVFEGHSAFFSWLSSQRTL